MLLIPLREIIAKYDLKAKKKLGQHFLLDPQLLHKIVKSAGPFEENWIIEIGPGPGGLTREILNEKCTQLTVVEQDERCIPIMEELKKESHKRMAILHDDALSVALHKIGEPPRQVISNLPYNISVPILLKCLEHIDHFTKLTFMFQKEVANRLIAKPRSSDYGRLSVMTQWVANVEKLFDLPPKAFTPPPKVTSTVVQITPRKPRETVTWKALEYVVKVAFSQRRKMLRSTLKGLSKTPVELLHAANIQPTQRAEELNVADFCRLTQAWEKEKNV